MLVVAFVLGGICGYMLAALISAGAEGLEIKRLKMKLEAQKMQTDAERKEKNYWKQQARGRRFGITVIPGGGNDGKKVTE